MAKMTLNVKVNDLHFKYQPRVFQDELFGANLVILDQICDKLSCGQGEVYGQTDGRTDGQTQATTILLRPKRPRGKIGLTVRIIPNK